MQMTERNTCFLTRAGSTLVIILLVTAGCFLIATPVSAHPPSDMTVSYNELSHLLIVTITHQVPNPQTHYIKEVLVTINGKTVNDTFYTSQPDPDTITYTYPIDTKTTDEIVVTASCVLSGSLTRTLYNTGPIATTLPGAKADPAPIKASAGLLPLLGLVIYLGYRKG
jgi:hypothetical protein